MHTQTVTTTSSQQTMDLGKRLARSLRPGDVICLTGDLGAGKTTLTKGIAAGLGVHVFIKSPSFVIANEYHAVKAPLYHIDLYRLQGSDIESLGLEEYVYGNGICVIEWADRVHKSYFTTRWDISISWVSESIRMIHVEKVEA